MSEFASIVGWDIGGAHLKAARIAADGRLEDVVQLPCALWLGIDRLEKACDAMLARLPDAPVLHAVTMTGEMSDLFADRNSGVAAIVACLGEQLARRRGRDELRVFAGPAGFVDAAAAAGHSGEIASANWLASALCCARIQDNGIVVDIGSTTTDLIPFVAGRVCHAASDAGRLADGELVYAGIIRTALMALARRAPYAGAWRATMAEHFATTADVFRVLGELDEAVDAQPAADGGAKTATASARRLLRMVGEDLPGSELEMIHNLARWYRQRLLEQIGEALALRLSRGDIGADAPLVGAGIGRFLVDDLAARCERRSQSIEALLCPDCDDPSRRAWAAHCAPAVAVAQLARRDGR